MPEALEPATADAAGIYFELDRFELTDARRLELTGRWFGIRGRRFVRPTLTMVADGDKCRLLADIEHKPWSATDGESWIAAFPCEVDGEPIANVELGVAPDIAVELPSPGARPQRATARRRRPSERNKRPSKTDPTAQRLDEQQRENERLRVELERAESAKVEAAAAIARRDAVLRKLNETSAERDDARAECERLRTQRDHVLSERDHALGKCEQLVHAAARLQADLEASRVAAQRAESARHGAETERRQAQFAGRRPAVRMRRGEQERRGEQDWAGRLIALTVLLAAVLAFALIARVL